MKLCKHKEVKITDSPARSGVKAIEVLYNGKKFYYHFADIDTAKDALNKILKEDFCCYKDIHERLVELSGRDFYPLLCIDQFL